MSKSYYRWAVVAGAFLLLFCSTGTQFYAFPVFFEAIVRDTGWARAEIAAALSVGMFVSGITGMLIGGLLQKIGLKAIMLCGCILAGTGYYLLSTIEKLWQLYVYYGLIVAVWATCISLIPNLSAVESWFTQKRSTALGIATTGIGATLRQALHSRAFWGISIGVMLWACAYGTGIVHQVAFAVDIGIDATAAAGAISLLAVFSIVGRLGFGKLGDILDKRYVFAIGTCLQIVAFIVLIKTTNLTMLYIYACLIGMNVGSMSPILPGILADHFSHKHFGSIFGAAFFTQTTGMVIGPISGGLIFDITGSYYSAFLAAAILSFIAIVSVYFAGKPTREVYYVTLQ